MRSPTIIAIVMGVATETVDRCPAFSGFCVVTVPPRNSSTWPPTWIWSPLVRRTPTARSIRMPLTLTPLLDVSTTRACESSGSTLISRWLREIGQIVADQDPMRVVHTRAFAAHEEPVQQGPGRLVGAPGVDDDIPEGRAVGHRPPAPRSRGSPWGGGPPRSAPFSQGFSRGQTRIRGVLTRSVRYRLSWGPDRRSGAGETFPLIGTLAGPPTEEPGGDREQPGRALPGYEIGTELGRGAFGVVIAGRHRQLGRDVAIKRLAPGLVEQRRRTDAVPVRSTGPGVHRPPAHRPSVRLRRTR